MKRYQIIVSHEVIVYAEDERAAEQTVLNDKILKERTNLRCIYTTEIPMPEKEPSREIIDVRKAPGS